MAYSLPIPSEAPDMTAQVPFLPYARNCDNQSVILGDCGVLRTHVLSA
jgi:hypothetical protein